MLAFRSVYQATGSLFVFAFFLSFSLTGGEKFDPMLIEKWPLIQSYALEDYGW